MEIDLQAIKKKRTIQELLRFSFINLDKPTSPTSFQVSQFVKETLGVNKTSHLGTLDPMVSGALPIALSRACRLNDYFMHRDKTYVGVMRLHEPVAPALLKEQIKKYIGKITQLPPVRSRVKREERIREVKTFQIVEQDNTDILFDTTVQAGTYIRKLIHDLGEAIGGAHMLELRRTQAGIFNESTSHSLYELTAAIKKYNEGDENPLRALLIPGEIIAHVLPTVFIKKDASKKCLTGSPLFFEFLASPLPKGDSPLIAVFADTTFIGCYRLTSAQKPLAVPEFVFN